MTTWAQTVKDGPDIDTTKLEVHSNHYGDLSVDGSGEKGTLSSPLCVVLDLPNARMLFGSLGRAIEEIEANKDPS